MSMPTSRWRRTTSRTAESISCASAASSTGSPSMRAQKRSASSSGRGRLPAWVVLILRSLILMPPPSAPRGSAAMLAPGGHPSGAGDRAPLLDEPGGAAPGERLDGERRVVASRGGERRGAEDPEVGDLVREA